MLSLIEWMLLIVMSFLPPIIYTIWIRNTERCHRQQWISIFLCFLWGATIAVMASFILELILQIPLTLSFQNANLVSFVAIVAIAPVVEEWAKPLALRLHIVKNQITELEDGLIYGAIAGLGFSATENLFYGWGFLSEGLYIFFVLICLRSISSCLLHASATALTGYGYGKTIMNHASLFQVIPYFLLAIFVHALFNFVLTIENIGVYSGFLAAMLLVAVMISIIRRQIRALDAKNC